MKRSALTLASVFALTLTSAFVMGGCATDSVGSESSNVTDSWSNPTSHGELSFEHTNQAEFDEQQRFHAWDFTLSGEATVDMRTELVSPNLDSIAYLYKRNPESGNWGDYIAKNDDHDGQPSSRISKKLDAGEYRLKVRAYKSFQRGQFSVEASCTGEGCPSVSGDVCSQDSEYAMPAETDPTDACVAVFDHILIAPVTQTFGVSVAQTDRCEGGSLAAKGFDYYKQFWADTGYGWDSIVEDYFEGDEAMVSLNVDVTVHGDAGATVGVDMGGDEDHVTFILDGDGDMVAYYWSNQSPTSGFACAKYPGAEHDYVDEYCVGDALHQLPHAPGDVSDSGEGTTTAAAAQSAMPLLVASTIGYFVNKQELNADSDEVTYAFEIWEDWGAGAVVTLEAGDVSRTYHVANSYSDDVRIIAELDGDALQLVCEEP
jgi:hypothetical protein